MLRYKVISGLDQHHLLHVKVILRTQIILGQSLSLSLNISISASQSLTPAVCTMWLVVGGGFSTLMHIKFGFLIFIKKYISVLQANMKVHSQGCMEVVTHHMRENITTLVGFIVATLFIQVKLHPTLLSSQCTAHVTGDFLGSTKYIIIDLKDGESLKP